VTLALEKFVLFTLVLGRVTGLLMSAPIFGNRTMPMQFRALLAVAVAVLALAGQWNAQVAVPVDTMGYLLLMGGEALVGLCLGLGIDILLTAANVAGQIVGQASGESLAEIYDPQTDENFAVHAQLFAALATMVFVAVGGHRLLMGALLDTFQAIPPGHAGAPGDGVVECLYKLLTQAFSLGIRVAAPTVVALMLTTLVLGLVSRTLPQLNIMAMGFGLNSLVTYGVLMLTVGAVTLVFEEQLEPALESLVGALAGKGPPG
jgi:flagellar biosynthesis protein FliR